MRDGGRLSAAIEILTDVETRHRPVKLALKAWGDASRFAGAKDRAWVSGLVLDVLRRRRSLAWRMEDDSPRAAVLCALHVLWDWPIERIAEAAADKPHGPGPLTAAGTLALSATAMPVLAVDDRPPISSAATSTVYDSHDTYQITIAAAPGMDMQAMEKSLRAMLNKIENEKRARQRSKLSDRD